MTEGFSVEPSPCGPASSGWPQPVLGVTRFLPPWDGSGAWGEEAIVGFLLKLVTCVLQGFGLSRPPSFHSFW